MQEARQWQAIWWMGRGVGGIPHSLVTSDKERQGNGMHTGSFFLLSQNGHGQRGPGSRVERQASIPASWMVASIPASWMVGDGRQVRRHGRQAHLHGVLTVTMIWATGSV